MKTKLVSALGLALLAASLTFNSSFACSQSSEATISALPVIALESNEAATESLPAAAAAESASAETSTSEASPAQVDEPAAIVSANESSPIEASAADRSVAAIVVEIVETVTIVVPGQSADDEEVEHTGSASPDRAATEPASVPDAEVLAAEPPPGRLPGGFSFLRPAPVNKAREAAAMCGRNNSRIRRRIATAATFPPRECGQRAAAAGAP
jgi:hypothetical protein